METVASPASILATRDWLVSRRTASSSCVRCFLFRNSRRHPARARLVSMYAMSASDKSKNSLADPSTHPFFNFFMTLPLGTASIVGDRRQLRPAAFCSSFSQTPEGSKWHPHQPASGMMWLVTQSLGSIENMLTLLGADVSVVNYNFSPTIN